MVDDRVRDGSRIGELLSSEVHGHERGVMGRLSVVDADTDATPSTGGTFAYALEYATPPPAGGSRVVATAHLHPEHLRLDIAAATETAVEAAEREDLPTTDPGDVGPENGEWDGDAGRGEDGGREVVAVAIESGAAVKPALRVVRAVTEALDDEVGES